METITTAKGTFLFVEITNDGVNFVSDMGYLIYKVPNYDTWISDKDLWNPIKCMQYADKIKGKDEWKQVATKLPDGNYMFIAVMKSFVTEKHVASQNLNEETASLIVGDNGMGCWDNYRLKPDEVYTCTSAMDSFNCLMLLSKHSLKVDSNYAILKLIP